MTSFATPKMPITNADGESDGMAISMDRVMAMNRDHTSVATVPQFRIQVSDGHDTGTVVLQGQLQISPRGSDEAIRRLINVRRSFPVGQCFLGDLCQRRSPYTSRQGT